MTEFAPGATLGILGGGQLGRLLAQAARRMGYFAHVYAPQADSPAGQVADRRMVAAWEDETALQRFARDVDVVTLEFENIPATAARIVEALTPVYPQSRVLETTQNRAREKSFLQDAGIPVAPFAVVRQPSELEEAAVCVGFPLVLKTADSGYDGKGQARADDWPSLRAAYREIVEKSTETGIRTDIVCTLERFVDLEREISVIAARTENGDFAAYPPVENRHRNHILDITLAPAPVDEALKAEATGITRRILEHLDMRGLLCVEFFQSRDGRLLVNELAPRPHNSGHYTLEAAACSQFEQQVRAVCGLPLGETTLVRPAAMANLLGELWDRGEPDWERCRAESEVFLHLYGKSEARPGRKMGHLTALGDTAEEALSRVIRTRNCLEDPRSL
jgi:5-(carboxyamino)imidazole ribonucleotide synthase